MDPQYWEFIRQQQQNQKLASTQLQQIQISKQNSSENKVIRPITANDEEEMLKMLKNEHSNEKE